MLGFLIGLFLLLLVPAQVLGAGRVQIEANQKSGPAGAALPVKIKLLQGDAEDSQPSRGEKAEIKIKNAETGQECKTDLSPSDSSGYVGGMCLADKPGPMTIYAVSKDRGDQSEEITLTFTEEKPTPSGNPKTQTKTQTQQASANAGSQLANQEGLAEENNQPLLPGLSENEKSSGDSMVAGAQTSQALATPTNDLDLLTSLVYLTGGIVLIITCIYFIYIQTRNANRKKKEEKPQPPTTGSPPVI